MSSQVVFPPTRVVTHLTLERFMVGVDVKMVSQTLLVRVLMTTNVALMRFGLTVGSLVASHGRSCMGAEATGVAHERSLVGVFEPLVFIKGSLLHSSIVAVTALESHGGLLGVFPHDMVLQHMRCNAFEVTKLTGKVFKQRPAFHILTVLGSRVFDKI